MATGFQWTNRRVLALTGSDVRDFLQGLISNDIAGAEDGLIYAALLSPQGKYLFDFFVFRDGDAWLVDVAEERAAALAQRLTMYKLRADVAVSATERPVYQLWDSEAGYPDPRHEALGRRAYEAQSLDGPGPDWEALRVAHLIPETGQELIADETFILEANFEAIRGVDFKKGCYVGQEVTARMKHKTELRKGLARVEIDGSATAPAAITAEGKAAGQLTSIAGSRGLAHLRFDRARGDMETETAVLRRLESRDE